MAAASRSRAKSAAARSSASGCLCCRRALLRDTNRMWRHASSVSSVPARWKRAATCCYRFLELTEKTMRFRSDKDDAGRQLDPTEIAARTTIQTPSDATELSQKGVPTLDGATNAAHARLAGATTLGRLHPKARRVGEGVGGAVAI